MKRRRYLALATAALAGCTGSESEGTPPQTTTTSDASGETPTKTPTGTRTPVDPEKRVLDSNEPYQTVDGQTVRLSIYRARRGIVEAGMVHNRPLVPEDKQFLQVGVKTDGEDGAPDPEELCLAATVDGERPFEGCTARVEAIDSDRQGTVQAVPVPLAVQGEEAAIVWQRADAGPVRWVVPDRTLASLHSPPEFVVESVSVPETVPDGEPFDIEITVSNEGGRKDWFVAELGLAAYSDGLDVEIPYDPDETRTVSRELTANFGDSDELLVRLDWDVGSVEEAVQRA